MPWPWSSDTTRCPEGDKNALGSVTGYRNESSGDTAVRSSVSPPYRFSSLQTITACLVTTIGTLGAIRIYKQHLRRIPNVAYIKPEELRKRSIYGYVTSVGDADNFRLFHTPGGRLTGWRWLPSRRVKLDKKWLKDKTVHVRIAGIDAPELAHFGREAQPFSQEALEWLRAQVLHRQVRALPLRKDQYDRVVCSVILRKWLFFKTDLGLEMLKAGHATVYEAKFGSEFGELEEQYRAAEKRAKERKIGMWQKPGVIRKILGRKESFESPREYKNRGKKEG